MKSQLIELFKLRIGELRLKNLDEIKSQGLVSSYKNYDGIRILIEDYQTLHFDLVPEKGVELQEQIHWQVANIIPVPMEQISFAYTIFNKSDSEIIGLGAYLEKSSIQESQDLLEQKGLKLLEICSPDKQFYFYQHKTNFWDNTNWWRRIFHVLFPWIIAAFGIILAVNFYFHGQLGQLKVAIADKGKELAELRAQVKQQELYQQKNAQYQQYNQQNAELTQRLYALTLSVPEKISFSGLNYQQQELKVSIICQQEERYLNRFLNKLKGLKKNGEVYLLSAVHQPDLIQAELMLKAKAKKVGR